LRVRFPMVSLGFFIDIILLPHYDSGVDSASNRNEYQEYSLGGKGGWCVGLTTLRPSCADCLEIWNPQGLSRPVMGLLYLLQQQKNYMIQTTCLHFFNVNVIVLNFFPIRYMLEDLPKEQTSCYILALASTSTSTLY
jgi:hypothetical protein